MPSTISSPPVWSASTRGCARAHTLAQVEAAYRWAKAGGVPFDLALFFEIGTDEEAPALRLLLASRRR